MTSSNRTTVQWLFKGVAVPECDDNSTLFQNICDTTNQKMICTTRTISAAENFIVASSLNLHICNMTVNSSGEYTCAVQGIDIKVVHQNNLIVQQTVKVAVNATSTDILDNGNSNDNSGSNNTTIWIVTATAVLMLALSIFMIGIATKLLCYLKKHQTLSIQKSTNHYDIELAAGPTKMMRDNKWEFPRENLTLLQRLGVLIHHACTSVTMS